MSKVKSIRINYVLNITRTIISTLIGLVIFPYINKTLGVDSVGKYEYAFSIINYFVLFSSLGIPMYGIREIAKYRDNIHKQSKIVVELSIILFITTILSYGVLFCLVMYSICLENYQLLLFVISPTILLTNIGFEWFFQGIEDQMYITIRFIIVKIITLVLLFTLVNDSSDTVIYASIMTFSLVGSNLFNFFYIRKFLSFSHLSFNDLNFKNHLNGILTIFLATISISVYLQLDNTLLGILVGDKYVGLYSTANKLIRFAILFVTTLGAVMLPRLSFLLEFKQHDEYNNYLKKSLNYILFFSLPIAVLIYSFADIIINIMAGDEFKDAVLSMRILSPLVLIIGIAYYLAFMVLYPQGKEKVYTIIVFISALVSLGLNLVLIPKYFHIATSWVNLGIEILGVFLMLVFTRKQLISIGLFQKTLFNYFVGSMLLFVFLYFFQINDNRLDLVVLKVIIGLLIYFFFLVAIKDKVTKDILNKLVEIKDKISR
jgi:O-antigen/teichoic acid export membrane protein